MFAELPFAVQMEIAVLVGAVEAFVGAVLYALFRPRKRAPLPVMRADAMADGFRRYLHKMRVSPRQAELQAIHEARENCAKAERELKFAQSKLTMAVATTGLPPSIAFPDYPVIPKRRPYQPGEVGVRVYS